MACFGLQKKPPFGSDKAKTCGITSTLQSKFHKLRRSKTAINISSPGAFSRLRRRLSRTGHHSWHGRRSSVPVHVDETTNRERPPVAPEDVEPPRMEEQEDEEEGGMSRTISSSLSSDGEYWSVDRRAESFLAEFWEALRLERQRSLEEYQEMIARGAS